VETKCSQRHMVVAQEGGRQVKAEGQVEAEQQQVMREKEGGVTGQVEAVAWYKNQGSVGMG